MTTNTKKFSLTFDLDGRGWAHATVRVGDAVHESMVSYLTSNPLGLFTGALEQIIWPEDGALYVVAHPGEALDLDGLSWREFEWLDEPGGWRWRLRTQNNAVRVRLESLGGRKAPPQQLLDSTFALRDVVSSVVECVEAQLRAHGIAGYTRQWHLDELPLARYLLLKRWLASPQYDPRRVEGSTWVEDLDILRKLTT